VTVAVTVEAVWKAGVDAVVVALLQALNTEVATNSNAVKPMSHFLLNLFDNLRFSFLLFPLL
jgi:Na+/H+ antiporter NhaD/arsenite permease-like protein